MGAPGELLAVVPQFSALSAVQDRTPEAGVGSSNLPRRTRVLLQVRGGLGAAAAVGAVSDLPGIGQRVVSYLSQDVDGLPRTWTGAGGPTGSAAGAPLVLSR